MTEIVLKGLSVNKNSVTMNFYLFDREQMMATESTLFSYQAYLSSRMLSGLGAVGIALQNYPAVHLFMNGLIRGGTSVSNLSKALIEAASLSAGGLCSGMVNYWMNVELLDGFFERMNSTKEYQYKRLKLTAWQKLQYFGGIFVFVVTGILYGLMAFTFAMEGPLATLSIAAGLFVAGIMTVQEVETWLVSYEPIDTGIAKPLTNAQQLGKGLGHLIAVGNVVALSLLFTLSLAEGLIALHVAALPALITGLAVAFTFGAFTEYYFYNFYLANFCKDLKTNLANMMRVPYAWIGLLCISTNAFVNAALTYAGIELLQGLLVAASIALPPATAIIILAATAAFFAGSASFILGADFWTRQNKPKQEESAVSHVSSHTVSIGKSAFGLFAENREALNNSVFEMSSARLAS